MKKSFIVLFFACVVGCELLGMDRPKITSVAQRQSVLSSSTTLPVESAQADIEIDPESLEPIYSRACGNFVQQWWHRLSQGKKDALELGVVGLGAVIFDVIHCSTVGCDLYDGDWFASVLVAYAIGKLGAHITERHRFYLRIIGGVLAWAGAAGFAISTNINISTIGIASIMYLVHTIFIEYAKTTGRQNLFTVSFKDLPTDLQHKLMTGILGESV